MPNPGPTGPYSNSEPPTETPESGTGPKADGTLGSKVKPPGAKNLSDPIDEDKPTPGPGPKADGSWKETVTPPEAGR